jgi:hypothetical protein
MSFSGSENVPSRDKTPPASSKKVESKYLFSSLKNSPYRNNQL